MYNIINIYLYLLCYVFLIDASPDTFETPQPIKGPSSSRTIDPTVIDLGKHDESNSKNTGK